MQIMLRSAAVLLIALPLVGQDTGPLRPDPELMNEINHIKAIDNHSHPPALANPGENDDDLTRCHVIPWIRWRMG
jgi:hypothetical protein